MLPEHALCQTELSPEKIGATAGFDTRTLGLCDNQYPVGPSPDKDLELDREVNPALPLYWATLPKN